MIKEKITPELKSSIKIAINEAREKAVETGFLICEKDNKLIPGKRCEGTFCSIFIKDPQSQCNNLNPQGFYHTHEYSIPNPITQMKLQQKTGRRITNYKEYIEEFKKDLKENLEVNGIKNPTMSSPTHSDLILALRHKCENKTNGTVCIGNDLDNNLECWTAKTTNRGACQKAKEEQNGKPPKKWILPLFDREIIRL